MQKRMLTDTLNGTYTIGHTTTHRRRCAYIQSINLSITWLQACVCIQNYMNDYVCVYVCSLSSCYYARSCVITECVHMYVYVCVCVCLKQVRVYLTAHMCINPIYFNGIIFKSTHTHMYKCYTFIWFFGGHHIKISISKNIDMYVCQVKSS